MNNEAENKTIDRRTVVVLCCLVAIAGVGINNCNGIFTTPVCTDLAFLQSQLAVANTLSSLTAAVFTLRAPKFLYRHGARKTILLASLLYGGSFIFKGFMRNIWGFILAGFLGGIGYSLFCMTVIFIIINSYYREKNGVVTSIVMCFSGLSGSLFSPVLAGIIELTNWRTASMLCGITVILLCVPMVIAGQRIDVRNAFVAKEEKDDSKRNYTTADHKKYMILMCTCFILAHFSVVFGQYLSSYGQNIGMDAKKASYLLSLAMAGNVAAKLADGYLSDRIGIMPANILMYALNTLACIGYLLICNENLMIANSLFFGAIYSITGMGMSLIVRYIFTLEEYADIYPVVSLCGTAGYALWTIVIGSIYDIFGNYNIALVTCVIFGIATVGINLYVWKDVAKKRNLSNR